MPPWLKLTALLAALPLTLLVLHLLFLCFERKGWMYYRKPRPKSSAYSPTRGVLSTFQEIVQPEVRYVKEDRDQRKASGGSEDPSDR